VWLAYGGRLLGSFVLRDQPRAEAREALDAMRALGIGSLILLTGDRAAAAREVGAALGMDEVVAEVLPAQQREVVRAEQAAGRTVMMVGDGVNDALALGGSDVGVAIGAELNEVALAVLVVVANSARILRFDNGDKPVAAVVATPGSDTESGAGAPVPGDPDQAEAALVPRPPEKVDAAVS